MGGGIHAVRPQLFAQEPNKRLSAGQVDAYLYIWSLAGVATAAAGRAAAGAGRSDGVRSRSGTGQPGLSGVSSLGLRMRTQRPVRSRSPEEVEEMHA